MHSIGKNFLYNAAYQILLILLPLITTPYISRVLGADRIGIYTYTYTVVNYFVLIAMLGVKNYGNRSVAAVRDDPEALSRTFWEIYGLQFLCSLLALVAYLAFVFFFETENRVILIIQSIYLFAGMLDISWLFFGLEQFKVTVLRNIALKLLTLVCIFVFVRTQADLWKYAFVVSFGTLLSQSYLWLYLRRHVTWQRPALSRIFSHLRAELILFIPVIAVSLYKMMDKIMLKELATYTQVGYYESAEKILNIPTGVITALGTVMLPRMSNLAAKAKTQESKRYIYNSMLFAIFLASGMMFGIAGIAEDFVPLFLGDAYLPCIGLLQALSATVLFISWANVIRTQYLIPNHRDRSYIISVLLGAAINLVLNALLIPRMEAMGAVVGTLCAEAAVCISQTLMVRKDLEIGRYLKATFPFLLMGAGMLLLIRQLRGLFPSPVMTVVLQVAVGICVYAAACGICLSISHKELFYSLFRKFIPKKR